MKMKRLLGVIMLAVLAHSLILLVQAQDEPSNKDLESLLEQALNRLREKNEKESTRELSGAGDSDLGTLASTMADALRELTEAIQNNTKEMTKRLEPTGVGSEETVHCETPFFPVQSECFYVNKYKRVSWSEARKFCKGLGSDLAEPARVNTLRAMLLDKFPEDEYKFFWVGATETATEGNWTWISSRRVQASDWASGQPDGGNENCVVLSRDDYPPLHDSPCYTHTMFICERLILHRQ